MNNMGMLLNSLMRLRESLNEQVAGKSYLNELAEFVWYLSVSSQTELDEAYNFSVEDERFWGLSAEVHAIFGRVYAASLRSADQQKSAEVSMRLIFPYCNPTEWEDVKNGLGLQFLDAK